MRVNNNNKTIKKKIIYKRLDNKKKSLTLWWCDFLDRKRWGAPPGGCNGTAGSGVTVCTGRGGLSVNFFRLATRLSHINETSSIRCKTYHKINNKKKIIIYYCRRNLFPLSLTCY